MPVTRLPGNASNAAGAGGFMHATFRALSRRRGLGTDVNALKPRINAPFLCVILHDQVPGNGGRHMISPRATRRDIAGQLMPSGQLSRFRPLAFELA